MHFLCSWICRFGIERARGLVCPYSVVQGFQRGDLTPFQCRTATLFGCDHSSCLERDINCLQPVFSFLRYRCLGDAVVLSITQPWWSGSAQHILLSARGQWQRSTQAKAEPWVLLCRGDRWYAEWLSLESTLSTLCARLLYKLPVFKVMQGGWHKYLSPGEGQNKVPGDLCWAT